jgi:uncharacterized membrane protein YdbT with pleckstrin-like domain
MLPALIYVFRRIATRYAITNKGLIRRTGVLTTNTKSVPFTHITSVHAKESMLGKLFHHGTLLIDTSGSGRGIEERWNFVKGVHRVKKLIEKHIA